MHLVCRKGKYWSLEESYREGKKVKKRTLAYYGTRNPSADRAQARYEQMLDTAERKGREWDDFQRKEFGETASERRDSEEREAKFSQEKFLGETTGPNTQDNPTDTQASSDGTSLDAQTASEPSSEPEASVPDGGSSSEGDET